MNIKNLIQKGIERTFQYFFFIIIKKLRFTPCKPEQPLQGMELHEKEAQKD